MRTPGLFNDTRALIGVDQTGLAADAAVFCRGIARHSEQDQRAGTEPPRVHPRVNPLGELPVMEHKQKQTTKPQSPEFHEGAVRLPMEHRDE